MANNTPKPAAGQHGTLQQQLAARGAQNVAAQQEFVQNTPQKITSETTTTQTMAEMKEEMDRIKAENAALEAKLAENKAAAQRSIYMKVSDKGAASLYGLGRFPVTLYVEQWNRVLDMAPDIKAFLESNKATLKTKGQE